MDAKVCHGGGGSKQKHNYYKIVNESSRIELNIFLIGLFTLLKRKQKTKN